MGAPKGNKYWQLREKIGREKKFSPDELYAKAIEYFNWVIDNPIEILDPNDKSKHTYKIRPMSKKGFCIFIGLASSNYFDYHKDNAYRYIIHAINDVIAVQQTEMASIGEFKENIIARMQGLAEKQEVQQTVVKYMNVSKQFDDKGNPIKK